MISQSVSQLAEVPPDQTSAVMWNIHMLTSIRFMRNWMALAERGEQTRIQECKSPQALGFSRNQLTLEQRV
jgi:hypothetical protein